LLCRSEKKEGGIMWKAFNSMEAKDVITIALTLYGLLISSYLCIQEIQKRKRKLNFSHTFRTSIGLEEEPNVLLKLYVNNASAKLLEIVEIGAFSKTGSIPLQRGDPKIAKLPPGESHVFSLNLSKNSKIVNTIKGCYVIDSFGGKHKYKLTTPLLTQFANSAVLEVAKNAGFRIGAGLEVLKESFEEGSRRSGEIVDEMGENLRKHLEEQLALRRKGIEELEIFNIKYEGKNALKEKIRQRVEANQEICNELKNKLENLR
jgi:hypothetical protein